VSLKKPSELFEQRRNQSLADELAQKKRREELELSNKRIASPTELFGEIKVVEEEAVIEEPLIIEEPVDPYLEEIELLRNDLERVVLSIPEETDLTKVFQDIQILRNRINNIPNQKDYSGDIQSIREELVRIEGSIPVPEVFDPSDLYENISALKNKLEEVRSEIPTIPEPILYDYQLDQLKEMVVDVRNSIPVVPEIRYYEDDLNKIINVIEEVRSEIPVVPEIKYYDDEISLIENRLIEIQNSIPVVPEIKYYDNDVKELKEEIASVKGSIPEVRYYDNDVKELKEEIASVKGSIPEVRYYDEEVKDLYKKVSAIKIPDTSKYLNQVKDVYSSFEQKNHKLLKKIKYLEEVFERFNEQTLTEGLLNEPPEVKNSDPLTPLDRNFVTLDHLQQHYRLFINRIQQQLSTLGGGGETRLKYLDDIVGIATNSSAYDGKFLKYNHSIGKFEFDAVSGGGGDYASVAGIATYATYSGIATTATYLADAANIITGVIDRNRINTTSALSVVGDLYVSGNISFGGTTTQLNTEQLQIVDSDIILGIGTSFSPTDNTANHGGIAIASTEGTPLVNLNIVPAEILPPTYKKIMWFKGNTIGAGITDAWLFNYGVGIGSTQVPNGVRLAVGGVHITDTTISANSYSGRGTNLTGIVTSIIAGVGITVTSSTGQVTVSSSDPVLQNPIFTYTSGALTSILYSSGATKTFTYTDGVLTRIDLVVGSKTFRKVFNYTGGILTSITETEF
jgi:hypothetical protein